MLVRYTYFADLHACTIYIAELYACTIYIADLLDCMIYVHELKIKLLKSKLSPVLFPVVADPSTLE